MPERTQTVTRITEELLGGPVRWDGLTGTVRSQPLRAHAFAPRQALELTQEVWDTTEEKADALYEMIVRSIDWARIMVEASGLHLSKRFGDPKNAAYDPEHAAWSMFDDEVCPACTEAALLARDRYGRADSGSTPPEARQ